MKTIQWKDGSSHSNVNAKTKMIFFYNKFGYGIKECIIKFVTKATNKKLNDGGTNNDKLQVVLLWMKVVDLIGLYYVDVIQDIPYDKHKPNNMWGQTS